jgi:hypothetical protein
VDKVVTALAFIPTLTQAAEADLVKTDAGQMLPKPMAAYANCLTHEHNKPDGAAHCHGLLPGVAAR